jgi:hypothetical protein
MTQRNLVDIGLQSRFGRRVTTCSDPNANQNRQQSINMKGKDVLVQKNSGK